MTTEAPPSTAIAAARSASAASAAEREDETRLETYSKIIGSSPWYHKLFVALVVVQALYVVAERVSVLVQSAPNISSDETFFFGVIIISVYFAAWYGIHAILSVNYLELGAFRLVTLWLLARSCVDWATRADECANFGSACLAFFIVGLAFNTATLLLTWWMLPDLKWCALTIGWCRLCRG